MGPCLNGEQAPITKEGISNRPSPSAIIKREVGAKEIVGRRSTSADQGPTLPIGGPKTENDISRTQTFNEGRKGTTVFGDEGVKVHGRRALGALAAKDG